MSAKLGEKALAGGRIREKEVNNLSKINRYLREVRRRHVKPTMEIELPVVSEPAQTKAFSMIAMSSSLKSIFSSRVIAIIFESISFCRNSLPEASWSFRSLTMSFACFLTFMAAVSPFRVCELKVSMNKK